MVLDNVDRGFLEKEIDRAISEVPLVMKAVRESGYKKIANIREETDYVLGYVMGEIIKGFSIYFATRHGRIATPEELQEMTSIPLKRTKEIKDAIFNCG